MLSVYVWYIGPLIQFSFVVIWKVVIFLQKFLVFDASFSVALWGLSLTCALVTRELGRMMRLYLGYIAITLYYLGQCCNLTAIIFFLRFQIKWRVVVKDDEAILGLYCHTFALFNLITIILFQRFQIKLREGLKDDEALLGMYCHNFVYRNKLFRSMFWLYYILIVFLKFWIKLIL